MLRSCFEFLQKVFLGLMYPFSCVLWAINSKQLLRDKAEILGIFFCFPFYVHKLISPMDNFSFLASDS